MAYDPTLSTARDRVRLAVGDTGSVALLPGGETTYDALIAAATDEAEAVRSAARALAAYYANQPSSVSSGGESVTWADRIAQWNKIAAGLGGVTPGSSGAATGGETVLTPVW
jgi:hypothetical protein